MELKVEHIKKAYKKTPVLKDVSFVAQSGECIGIIGDNGSGKTTLLSILVGTEKGDGGAIYIDGKKTTGRISASVGLGYVPQVNPLPDNMKVKECLKLWCDNKEQLSWVVDKYDLSEMLNKTISKLSGGMKRRVSIACAMAAKPKLLIMDEPTAALDIKYKSLIHKDMEDYVKAGGLLVIVTHEKEEMDMCNRCYRMIKGKNEEV